jgi:hypothetical protein
MLLGVGRRIVPIPRAMWQRHLSGGADLGFMSGDHHRVRNFVVTELARVGKPLSPESIAQALSLPGGRVTEMLVDLERRMTFLFRNEEGAVAWAYPVTVERTPHHVTLSTGEQVYAA